MSARLFTMVARVILLGVPVCVRADASASPDFSEVRSVVREHLPGVTDADLNRAAVAGLLTGLNGAVTLVTNADTVATNKLLLVSAQNVFDKDVGYVRINRIQSGLAAAVAAAVGQLTASNKLVGLVLDLRYARGEDYAAATATVDLFLSKEVPLLNAGTGLVRSKEKSDAIRLPVVALINSETSGAAEALGAMLRETGLGLLVGSATAGHAGVTSDFKLSSGQTLRVVTAPVQLGNAKAIPTTGVLPDISVELTLDDEAQFYADPFTKGLNGGAGEPLFSGTNGAGAATGSSKRIRVTEADLVREKRGDGDVETVASARVKAEPESPKVKDPALARAIDLLKGLAVARQWKF